MSPSVPFGILDERSSMISGFVWYRHLSAHFMHMPYLKSLPPPSALLTPLHFTPAEFELLKGTNLYRASIDRRSDFHAEWETCKETVKIWDDRWASGLTL